LLLLFFPWERVREGAQKSDPIKGEGRAIPVGRAKRPKTENDIVKARMDDHQSSTNDVHSKGFP
jgi:hypothetical protein